MTETGIRFSHDKSRRHFSRDDFVSRMLTLEEEAILARYTPSIDFPTINIKIISSTNPLAYKAIRNSSQPESWFWHNQDFGTGIETYRVSDLLDYSGEADKIWNKSNRTQFAITNCTDEIIDQDEFLLSLIFDKGEPNRLFFYGQGLDPKTRSNLIEELHKPKRFSYKLGHGNYTQRTKLKNEFKQTPQ